MKTFIKRLAMAVVIMGTSLIIANCSHTIPLQQTVKDKGQAPRGVEVATKAKVQAAYGQLPLYFIQNDGQMDKRIKFYEQGNGHGTFFTKDGIYINLYSAQPLAVSNNKQEIKGPKTASGLLNLGALNSERVKLAPLGVNKDPEIIGEGLQEGRFNYIKGKDPSMWKTNIPTYRAVVYKEIYPGMDMKFYGNNRQLEYDIIVKPGADPSMIRLAYEGIESLRLTKLGDLEIILKEGKIIQNKPYVYQDINGKRVEVAGKFKLHDLQHRTDHLQSHIYSFEVEAYNVAHTLIIDPTLLYSTYLGGSDSDVLPLVCCALDINIAVDGSGSAYVAGSTLSSDFDTTPGAHNETINGLLDGFVTKLNPAGSAIVYSTFLGGSGDDHAHDIALDSSGNAYIVGFTSSGDFPTPDGFETTFGGVEDGFVAKLNDTGTILLYSTYLGDSEFDTVHDIAVDSLGMAYVVGGTNSPGFPTTAGAFDITCGTDGLCSSPFDLIDGFVAKLDPSLSGVPSLVYSTFLGADGVDFASAIAIDGSGIAYVSGRTFSFIFPTTAGAYDVTGGGFPPDAFVTKLIPDNSNANAPCVISGFAYNDCDDLVYSTFLGGSDFDQSDGITVDGSGIVYATGGTVSGDFPTTGGAYDETYNGSVDQYVTKLIPDNLNANAPCVISGLAYNDCTDLVYSTYLGGSDEDNGHNNVIVDSLGNIYLSGGTFSGDFPITGDAIDPTYNGGGDAYLVKIQPLGGGGADLVFSTFLGGTLLDTGHGLAIDILGNFYMSGRTVSPDFPTTAGAYDEDCGTDGTPLICDGGFSDAIVLKVGGLAEPTLIRLSSFNVMPGNGQVVISWTTGAEIDNYGFNILRASSPNGSFKPVNPSIIFAKGISPGGASYSFVDTSVKDRTTYYYRLMDIDTQGAKTAHNVVPATTMLAGGGSSTPDQETVVPVSIPSVSDSEEIGPQAFSEDGNVSDNNPSSFIGQPFIFQTFKESGNTLEVAKLERGALGESINRPERSSQGPTSQESSRDVEIQLEWAIPDPITFKAFSGDGRISLEWTASGTKDRFNLLRSDEEEGEFKRINEGIILVPGELSEGAGFRYTDTQLINGKTYYYKLERITEEGKTLVIGPIPVTPRITLSQIESGKMAKEGVKGK